MTAWRVSPLYLVEMGTVIDTPFGQVHVTSWTWRLGDEGVITIDGRSPEGIPVRLAMHPRTSVRVR